MYKLKLTQQQTLEIKKEFPQSRIVAMGNDVYGVENIPESVAQKYQNITQTAPIQAKQQDIDFNYILNSFVTSYAKATIEKEVVPIIARIEETVSQIESRFEGLTTEVDNRIKTVNEVASSSSQNIQETKEEILRLIEETKTRLEKISEQFDFKVAELANDLEKNITAKIKEHLTVELQALQDERQMIKHTLEQENRVTNERICKIADHYRKFLQDFPKLEE